MTAGSHRTCQPTCYRVASSGVVPLAGARAPPARYSPAVPISTPAANQQMVPPQGGCRSSTALRAHPRQSAVRPQGYATPQTTGHMAVTLRRTCSAIANPKPPTLAAVTLFKKHVLGLYWQHSMPNTTRGADGRASGVFAALAGCPAGVEAAATRALSSDSATFTATPPRESLRRRRPGRARSNCARASKNCSSLNVRDTRLCRPPATAPHTPRHKRHGIQRELERATQRKGHEHAPTTLRPCTPRVQTQHTWRTQCGRRGLSTLTAPPAQHDTHISMTKPRANRTPCRSGPLWPWNTRSLRASKLSDDVDVNDSRRQALTQGHTGVSRRQTHLADTTVPPVAGNSAITDMSSHMSTFAL